MVDESVNPMTIPRGLNVNIESILHAGSPVSNTTVVKSYKCIDKPVCIFLLRKTYKNISLKTFHKINTFRRLAFLLQKEVRDSLQSDRRAWAAF